MSNGSNAEYQISILWLEDTLKTYTFKSKPELDAFRLGIAEAVECGNYQIVGEDE